MTNENTLIDKIPLDLLLYEMRAYGKLDCIKPLQQSRSCPNTSGNVLEWCSSCRAWAIMAYYEQKLPTSQYRRAVATHIAEWRRTKNK